MEKHFMIIGGWDETKKVSPSRVIVKYFLLVC